MNSGHSSEGRLSQQLIVTCLQIIRAAALHIDCKKVAIRKYSDPFRLSSDLSVYSMALLLSVYCLMSPSHQAHRPQPQPQPDPSPSQTPALADPGPCLSNNRRAARRCQT